MYHATNLTTAALMMNLGWMPSWADLVDQPAFKYPSQSQSQSHLPFGMFRYLTPLDCYVGSLVSGRYPGPVLRVSENLTPGDSVSLG